MKIAICDDNKQELLLITGLVNEFSDCNSAENKIEIKSFTSSIELLSQLENGRNFDVFILDIIMPILNGIQLAAEIRNKDQVGKIIFLTSSSEFAVDSYSVDAFNYLIKPIQKDKLFTILEKACLDISSDLQQYIVVKTQNGLSKVFLHELLYVEVIRRTIYLYLKSGIVLKSTSTISQIEAILLQDIRFIKPHRSYIVNLNYIKNLSQDGITTTSDLLIPISRNAFKEVKQAYINYSFQVED